MDNKAVPTAHGVVNEENGVCVRTWLTPQMRQDLKRCAKKDQMRISEKIREVIGLYLEVKG